LALNNFKYITELVDMRSFFGNNAYDI